jgi:hypothetical protein
MIYLYPEKHAESLDLDALVRRAQRGESYLLMEDGPTALTFKCPYIDSLEPVTMMAVDTMLACMVMMCDSPHETIEAMPGTEGFVLYSMLLRMLSTYSDNRFACLNYAAQELPKLAPQSLPELYQAARSISEKLMGGVPGFLRTVDIREYVKDLVAARTGLQPKQHMALYNFIKRERTMADKIQAVRAEHPNLDIHVVVGACHVSGDISDELMHSLAVHVESHQELGALIEGFYPKQRLLDLIGDYVIR